MASTSTPSPAVELMPDNRCCVCLTLRIGTAMVGFFNLLTNLMVLIWYCTSPTTQSSFSSSSETSSVNDLDITMLLMFMVEVIVDLILVYGALKKSSSHTVPWLCANAVIMGVMLMVLVSMLLFFGYVRLSLNYNEYVSLLSLLGVLSALHFFSCVVVFQFRRNVIDERRILARRMDHEHRVDSIPSQYRPNAPSPPPTYEEVSKDLKKMEKEIGDECDSPPGYDLAVAGGKEQKGEA